jgi:hypothetical protein
MTAHVALAVEEVEEFKLLFLLWLGQKNTNNPPKYPIDRTARLESYLECL